MIGNLDDLQPSHDQFELYPWLLRVLLSRTPPHFPQTTHIDSHQILCFLHNNARKDKEIRVLENGEIIRLLADFSC